MPFCDVSFWTLLLLLLHATSQHTPHTLLPPPSLTGKQSPDLCPLPSLPVQWIGLFFWNSYCLQVQSCFPAVLSHRNLTTTLWGKHHDPYFIEGLQQVFSGSGLLTCGIRSFSTVGHVPCTTGHLAAPLTSVHWIPPESPPVTINRCLQTSSGSPGWEWETKDKA